MYSQGNSFCDSYFGFGLKNSIIRYFVLSIYAPVSTFILQEEFYGRAIISADREYVEQRSDDILAGTEKGDVALLVVGDPLGATTHTDLMMRAGEKGLGVTVRGC